MAKPARKRADVRADATVRTEAAESTVTSFATGERIDVVAEPHCYGCHSATLAFLMPPLKLRQPIHVTVKRWTDGVFEAHFSDAMLYGTGDDEPDALEDLRANISDAWLRLSRAPESSLALPAWRMWQALAAVCAEDTLV